MKSEGAVVVGMPRLNPLKTPLPFASARNPDEVWENSPGLF